MTRSTYPDDVADPDDDAPTRSPRRRLIVGAAVAVVLAAFATWLVAFSSVLAVSTVTVTGERELTQAQVLAAADVPDGMPLVRVDTDAIRQRVEALPDVASASVTTSFPTTVRISVTERTPLGVVRSGSGFALVDATGDQYRVVAARPDHLPLFDLAAGSDQRASGMAVAAVAGALPARILARLSAIRALSPTEITLVLRRGRLVQWGGTDSGALKARLLPALLAHPGGTVVLSDPSQPYISS